MLIQHFNCCLQSLCCPGRFNRSIHIWMLIHLSCHCRHNSIRNCPQSGYDTSGPYLPTMLQQYEETLQVGHVHSQRHWRIQKSSCLLQSRSKKRMRRGIALVRIFKKSFNLKFRSGVRVVPDILLLSIVRCVWIDITLPATWKGTNRGCFNVRDSRLNMLAVYLPSSAERNIAWLELSYAPCSHRPHRTEYWMYWVGEIQIIISRVCMFQIFSCAHCSWCSSRSADADVNWSCLWLGATPCNDKPSWPAKTFAARGHHLPITWWFRWYIHLVSLSVFAWLRCSTPDSGVRRTYYYYYRFMRMLRVEYYFIDKSAPVSLPVSLSGNESSMVSYSFLKRPRRKRIAMAYLTESKLLTPSRVASEACTTFRPSLEIRLSLPS